LDSKDCARPYVMGSDRTPSQIFTAPSNNVTPAQQPMTTRMRIGSVANRLCDARNTVRGVLRADDLILSRSLNVGRLRRLQQREARQHLLNTSLLPKSCVRGALGSDLLHSQFHLRCSESCIGLAHSSGSYSRSSSVQPREIHLNQIRMLIGVPVRVSSVEPIANTGTIRSKRHGYAFGFVRSDVLPHSRLKSALHLRAARQNSDHYQHRCSCHNASNALGGLA